MHIPDWLKLKIAVILTLLFVVTIVYAAWTVAEKIR